MRNIYIMNYLNFYKSILSVICLLIIFQCKAQKLPATQEVSLVAPNNIKIDGKPSEWNSFQAYNSNTGFYYSIANSNTDLYLAIQAKDYDVINRILAGGITFSIQDSKDKKDTSRKSITYPIPESKNVIVFSFRPLTGQKLDTTFAYRDSVMRVRNKNLDRTFKSIGVYGIKGVDTVISTYNEDGIKASSQIDNRNLYTVEMEIKLKALKLSAAKAQTFLYHFQVNGAKTRIGLYGDIVGTPEAVAKLLAAHEEADARRAATTDFWGQYKLSNK